MFTRLRGLVSPFDIYVERIEFNVSALNYSQGVIFLRLILTWFSTRQLISNLYTFVPLVQRANIAVMFSER